MIEAIHPMTAEEVSRNVVRGQYVAGRLNDQDVAAYTDEPDVDTDSGPRPTLR